MKKIKYLFLILVIILFSGCAVKYDLNIDKDLSVTERVEATEKKRDVKTNTGMDESMAVKYLYDIYKRDGIKPSVYDKIQDENLIVTASVSHNSLDEYVKNFKSDIFKKAKLTKSGSIYLLSFKQSEKLTSSSSTGLIYDKVTINITVPFKVLEHNADSVHKNTYTWELKKDQKLRNLKIKFDKENEINYTTINLGFTKINIKNSILIASAIILIILVTVLVVYINNKKNNRF